MKTITRNDLRTLASTKAKTCVSIYMPLHGSQPDSNQDAIRLKNLLDRAEKVLLSQDMRHVDIDDLLRDARELQANASVGRTHGRKGLALLIEPKMLHSFQAYETFEELVLVGQQFHLSPLVHALSEPDRFLLLAVSANGVRLYHADQHTLTSIPLPEAVPNGLNEAMRGIEFDKGLQYHTSATHGIGGARVGIAHGHGDPKDDRKALLTEYLRNVSTHLEPILRTESVPLVLASVNYLHPIFRDVCRYRYLLSEGVSASPDGLDESDLHRRALDVVRPALRAQIRGARQRYNDLQATDRVGFHIEMILPAAERGRVEVLFAANGAHIWGCVNGGRALQVHRSQQSGDSDLLDLAVGKTIAAGGVVHIVEPNEVPSREPVAAILRW